MAKSEWGKKRICSSCGLKYYDFNNSPIICPSCKTEFDPDTYLKTRKGKSLSTKVINEDDNEISNLDDLEIENDDEVVSDDDPILDINKDEKGDDNEGEIDIDNNIDFIEDDDNSVEIIDDQDDQKE